MPPSKTQPAPQTIVPRFAEWWAALVYALAALALSYPALGGAFLVSPHSDQFIAGYAFREFAASSIRTGSGIPLWNPYLFGGMPYVAAMNGDIFYPTFLLRAVLPTDVAMTWSFIVHVFLAGVFTYGFLRAWGLGFLPALLGGLAYLMCGQVASLVAPGHDGKLYVSALFPLGLWILLLGIRDGRQWAWGLLALVVGLAVLSPHPQLLQYMLLGCGAFALFLAFAPLEMPDGTTIRLDRATALRRLLFALGAVLLGAVIGAVQYLPVREYVPFSPRAGGRDYTYGTSFSMPIEELFNTYLPQFTGILDRYWGRNGIHLHSEYLGAVSLLLAGAGLTSERRNFRWFWIGTFIVTTLWALGGNTPLYHLIYAVVPGTKFFRAPSTIFYIASFAVATLAALGLERVLARRVRSTYVLGWTIAALVIALLASMGALTNVAKVIASSFAGDQLDEMIDANNGALMLGAWRSFLAVALASLVVWLLIRKRIAPRAASIALIVLAAADLYSIEKRYWMFSPPASVLYASDPAIDYVRAQPEPARVITWAFGRTPGRDAMLEGDGLMVHRVRLVLGYHGNEEGRYQRLAGKTQTTGYNPRIIFSPTFWRHENVRFLYTDADEAAVKQIATALGTDVPVRVLGPVQNAAGSAIYLYRLPGDNPLAWLAPVIVKAPDQQTLATVLDPRFDPKRAAIVDTSAQMPAQQIAALPAPLTTAVRTTRYAPGRIDLALASPAPAQSALLVSENYFPGWTATVDGKAAPLTRGEYNLIAVALPTGASKVALRFDDASYERGKIITIVGVVLSLLLIAAGVASRRRARDAPPATNRREGRDG